jgi:hypothetical protein
VLASPARNDDGQHSAHHNDRGGTPTNAYKAGMHVELLE